jgi:hypothetical protein
MKVLISIAAVIATTALSGQALAAAPPGSPFPAKKVSVAIYTDTVTASKSSLGYVPTNTCMQTNFFARTAGVVFRMWAFDARTGDVLTSDNVKYAYVKIPGQPNMKLTFGVHGKLATSPSFWSVMWTIPADYPLGVVAFQVVVKTKKNTFGFFSQVPNGVSQLTVTP